MRQAIAHLVMGLGGEDEKDTKARIAAHGPYHGRGTRPRHSHRDAAGRVQSHESPGHRRAARQRNVRDGHGRAHGLQYRVRLDAFEQSAPYPWMNSLFQDGVTVGWLLG